MSSVEIDEDGISGEIVRRTLHFIWIVDESGSMYGQKIQSVNYAIKNVIPEILKIEENERINILMRVIKFGDQVSWHVGPEPMPIKHFIWEDMDANGRATNTASAIELLNDALELEKIGGRNVPPVIILLSDGYCTEPDEDYDSAIAKLNKLPWGMKAVRIAIGIGQNEDYNKEQLDQFISPYLRQESNLETLPANSVKHLVEYIKVVSTQAVMASSSSKSDTEKGNIAPVVIEIPDVEKDDGPGVESEPDDAPVDFNVVF